MRELEEGEVLIEENVTEDFRENLELTFTMEDGSEQRMEVIGFFWVEDRQYIAMYPLDQKDGEGRVHILPVEEDENGCAVFHDFESDEEYFKAEAAFNEYFNEDMDPDMRNASNQPDLPEAEELTNEERLRELLLEKVMNGEELTDEDMENEALLSDSYLNDDSVYEGNDLDETDLDEEEKSFLKGFVDYVRKL